MPQNVSRNYTNDTVTIANLVLFGNARANIMNTGINDIYSYWKRIPNGAPLPLSDTANGTL